jgi:hypothetical protein
LEEGQRSQREPLVDGFSSSAPVREAVHHAHHSRSEDRLGMVSSPATIIIASTKRSMTVLYRPHIRAQFAELRLRAYAKLLNIALAGDLLSDGGIQLLARPPPAER